MTKMIDLAKECGITYYLTPENTTEMHATDRQIEAFAEAVAAAEREACAKQLDLRPDDLRLMAGEMTAQEMRTVLAVLEGIKARMRSNAS